MAKNARYRKANTQKFLNFVENITSSKKKRKRNRRNDRYFGKMTLGDISRFSK